MILGNKCDMTDRRQVSKDRGEKVSLCCLLGLREAATNFAELHLISFALSEINIISLYCVAGY